ncbi:MAG TPA: aldehyde ferredoxin oxidoreductase N-terminal domain-containing protein, partial [Anaerolineales bacterium]
MNGWTGRLLRVDLSSGEIKTEPLDPAVLKKYLGGRGLGAYLVNMEVPPQAEPLSEQNILAFCTGPLTGVTVPTGGRSSLSTRSPLTGTILDANSGAPFGVRLKWAGYDALVVQGAAPRPVWLDVSSEGAQIGEAAGLWGQEVPEAIGQLAERGSEVVCIGPAGENRVLFASIMDEEGHAFGRGGVGAVMGSKNLKAIRVHGDHKPTPVDKEALDFIDYEARKLISASPRTSQGLPEFGTSVLVNLMNWYGVLPTRNFQQGQYEQAESLSGERLLEEFLYKRGACWSCPIGCKRKTRTEHSHGEGPE